MFSDGSARKIAFGTVSPRVVGLTLADSWALGWKTDSQIARSALNEITVAASAKITLSTASVLIPTTGKLNLRDIAIGIHSPVDSFMDLFADGAIRIGDSSAGAPTNYTGFAPNGSISQVGTARIDWTKITANSVVIATGGTDGSSIVANLQTENDGNVFHLDETAGTPGSDMYVEFVSVTAFNWVKITANYVGSATHGMGILLYDWVAAAWKSYECFQHQTYDVGTAGAEVKCDHSFFVPSDTVFIGTGGDAGKVRVRFVHPMAGNASHDVYLDVVALYQ